MPMIGTGKTFVGAELKLCCGAKHRETGADASCVGCTTRCQCMKLQPEQDGQIGNQWRRNDILCSYLCLLGVKFP